MNSNFNTNWRLSTCCKFHDKDLANLYNFGTTTKKYALAEGGKEKVQAKAISNCNKLLDVLTNYFAHQPLNLRSFRIGSDLLPCYTLDFTKDWYAEIWDDISSILSQCGEVARKHHIRLSTHPSQYCVLASNNPDVVDATVADLEYHGLFGSLMNIPAGDFVINIHLQGLYGGNHSDGIYRFAKHFDYLSDYVKACLAVENEDKPNGYDIVHVLDLATKIPIRCTLDTHHYACYRMTDTELVKYGGKDVKRKIRDIEHITADTDFFKSAVKTWGNHRPLFHTSHSIHPDNQAYWMKCHAHSDMLWDRDLVDILIPMLEYADFDIEAKHKEVAVQDLYNYVLKGA
jgi:UV DNA damage endonuclease